MYNLKNRKDIIMKSIYVVPGVKVVKLTMGKHLMEASNMRIQEGSKSFSNSLSREGRSNDWADDEE